MSYKNEKAEAFRCVKEGRIITFVYDISLSKKEKRFIVETLEREGKLNSSRGTAIINLLNSNITRRDAIELKVH